MGSLQVADVIAWLEELAPRDLAEEWDNPGLQVGSARGGVRRVLVALDATEKVIEEAAGWGAELVVSHHPLIFRPLASLDCDRPLGARLARVLGSGLTVYAAHTNLDAARPGTSDALARALGWEPGPPLVEGRRPGLGVGRIVELPEPWALGRLAGHVAGVLDAPGTAYLGDPERPVNRVVLVGGAGGDFIVAARGRRGDVLVTGDVRYHQMQLAEEEGLAVVDAGHFATEAPVRAALAAYLQDCARRAGATLQVRVAAEADPRRPAASPARPEPPGEEGSPGSPSPVEASLLIHTDGASRGNPGPAAIGAVILDEDGRVLDQLSEAIGVATNNVAEYRAVIRALERAAQFGATRIELRADSQLVIRQLRGEYRVADPGLKPLHDRARTLLRTFKEVTLEHVPREANREADRLANLALDHRA